MQNVQGRGASRTGLKTTGVEEGTLARYNPHMGR